MWIKKLLLLLSFTLLLSAEVVNIKADADNDFVIVKRIGSNFDVVYRSNDGVEWKNVQEYNLTIDDKELKDCEIDIIAWGDHEVQQALAASFSSNGNTIVTTADPASPIKSYVTKIENQAEWAIDDYPDDGTIIDIFDTMAPDETADLGSVQNNSVYGNSALSVGQDAHWIWANSALQGSELGNNFTVYTISCSSIINNNDSNNSDNNTTACIENIIDTLYHRAPNDTEMELWQEYINGKIDCVEFVHTLLSTEEAAEWSDEEYIIRVYQVIMDSEIDEDGLNYWVEQLESGDITRDDLIDILLNTPEAKICSKCKASDIDTVETNTSDNNDNNCIEVITHAYNPDTNEEKDFPTPCDVPEGWIVGSPDTINCDSIYDELSQTSDLDNKNFIKMAYQELNEEASQTDIDFWSQEFDAGLNKEDFINILSLLPEFKDKCNIHPCEGTQHIDENSSDNTDNATDNGVSDNSLTSFVERFYRLILGREADPDGLNYWVEHLQSGNLSGSDLANGFIHSTEFQNKNLDDSEYIKVLYRAFFNREADSAGFNYWLSQLENGASRDQVLNGFLLSLEFDDLCQQFGIRAF